jgi:hypothetical protein
MNRNVSNLILTVLLLLGFTISVFAQEAIIKVLPVSHHDLEQGIPDTTRWHSVSAGLKAVGVGELVYLEAMSDSNITSILWTPTFPPGSSAILDNTAEIITAFRPDMEGFFEVQLTVNGVADTSITIVSNTYYGVGHVDSIMVDPADNGCFCHNSAPGGSKAGEWAGTGHSTIFKLGVDGIISSHYSESCVECHTLGYNTEPEAVNGGFDDVALNLGWTFPAHPQAGEWDNIGLNFPDLAVVASIQCENCHGPFGDFTFGHMQGALPDISIDAGMCGRCHDEPWRHYRNEQWKHSPHNFDPKVSAHGAGARGASSSCVDCHSGAGFIEEKDEDYEVGDLYDTAGPGNVSCATCHEPHGVEVRTTADVELGNGAMVSAGGSGKLCMNCHKSRRDAETYAVAYHDHYGPHYGPQADMLAGDNVVTFGGGAYPSGQAHITAGDACVTCHMAPTPGAGVAPDPNDPAQYGRDRVGDHTFHIYWEGDGTAELDHTAGCTGCHGAKSSFDEFLADMDYDADGTIEPVQEEARGMMDKLAVELRPVGVTEVVVDTNYTTVEFQAAYNLFFVQEDGSKGIHNWVFTRSLLNRTYVSLTGHPMFIEDDISAFLPVRYVLEQNYPNPFNPSTAINFTLPKAEEIKVVVYDMLGKAIRTLVQGQVTAGTHTVTWDGQDQNGNKVSTGLYIYRLESKSVTLARKMLLVK